MAEGPDETWEAIAEPYTYSILAHHPDHAAAIGLISIEMGRLEIALGELLAALLHIDKDFGHVIYHTPQANIARIQIVENVLRYSLPNEKSENRQRVESYLTRARAYVGKRHEYIHNVWGVDDATRTKVTRQSVPFKSDKPEVEVPIRELHDLVAKIRRLITDLRAETRLIYKIWPPYTWQGKPREQPTDAKDPLGSPPADEPLKPEPPPQSSQG